MRIAYVEKQLDDLRAQLDNATIERSQKAIMRAIKTAQARVEKLLAHNAKDTGLRFEESGCDYLLVDEAHMYKNKQRVCNIEELSCTTAAQRAEDLGLKLDVLRQRRRDEALARGIPEHAVIERVATFATGTPIANSLGELWVMQTYLRPDLLEAAGVAELGDWGAAFTATHTSIEVNATGTKLRPVTRVAKYTNLPELLALSGAYTDVVTRDQVPVALPELRTGARQIISLQPDVELVDFIADLGWRADHLDARKPPARQHPQDQQRRPQRLPGPPPGPPRPAQPQPSRRSRRTGHAGPQPSHADRLYRDPDTGVQLPMRGALQLDVLRSRHTVEGSAPVHHLSGNQGRTGRSRHAGRSRAVRPRGAQTPHN